jgi:hypothetical protein
MARHVVNFDAERKLLTETLTTDNLEKAAPRLATFHEGIDDWRNMQNEISAMGAFCRRTGFTPDKSMQRLATIPTSVKKAIQEVVPDAFENKEKFYALLAGPLKQYDTRSRIVI